MTALPFTKSIKNTAIQYNHKKNALKGIKFINLKHQYNELNGVPLNFGTNFTHFLENEGFNSIEADSFISYFTSKNNNERKSDNALSQKGSTINPRKIIEVNSPSQRGASCFLQRKNGVGRHYRIVGKRFETCYVGSLGYFQENDGCPFRYSVESSFPVIPPTNRGELN